MATMPKVFIDVHMDDAIAALIEIRNKTILWQKDRAAERLREVHKIAQDALDTAIITPKESDDD